MMLMSPAFPPGGPIPAQYTCSGADVSPPLSWSDVPPATKSLVLVIEDPDAPGGVFHHWAVYDIPPRLHGLPAGYRASQPISGSREARNDFGSIGYGGPCPPAGGGAHHYHFRLYALSRPTLDLSRRTDATAVLDAAKPYVIAKSELVGTFRR